MKNFIFALLSFFSLGLMAQQNQSTLQTIKVLGEAVASTPVDLVRIRLAIQETQSSPSVAKRMNDDKVAQVLHFLRKEQKKHEMKFNTERITLSKENFYNRKEDAEPRYIASQTIGIQLKDLNFYDELMVKLLDLGITEIGYVSFEKQDTKNLKSETRQKAIENAREKAQEYAQVAGVKVGKVLEISEFGDRQLSTFHITGAALRNTMSDSVVPKNFEFQTQVSVVFELINP